MKILLIEDMAGFADPIRQQLEARGHTVTWIIGANTVSADRLQGILVGNDATPMNDTWDGDASRLVEVVYSDFDLALSDGGLIGTVNSGAPIVNALSKFGIPCIGITGGGAGNRLLTENGAIAGVPKEFVLLALQADLLPSEQNLTDKDFTSLATRLDSFTQQTREKAEQARKAGEKFHYGYPVLESCS